MLTAMATPDEADEDMTPPCAAVIEAASVKARRSALGEEMRTTCCWDMPCDCTPPPPPVLRPGSVAITVGLREKKAQQQSDMGCEKSDRK
jgi:hypothetical protein